MNTQARITISKRASSRTGKINITIEDDTSQLRIVEVEMGLSDFAECLTGLGSCRAELVSIPNHYSTERYGKRKVVEHVLMPKEDIDYFNKESASNTVNQHFMENYEAAGWELWNDGCSSQQPERVMHQYIICKYVEQEPEE